MPDPYPDLADSAVPNALGALDSQLIGETTHLQSGFCAQSSSSQKVSKQLVSEAL